MWQWHLFPSLKTNRNHLRQARPSADVPVGEGLYVSYPTHVKRVEPGDAATANRLFFSEKAAGCYDRVSRWEDWADDLVDSARIAERVSVEHLRPRRR